MGEAESAATLPTADHPLRMMGRGAYYSVSFDLGPGLDVTALADQLLRKDMAAAAASPSRGEIRVSARGARLDRQQKEAYGVSEFARLLTADDFSWFKLLRANQTLTRRLLWAEKKAILKHYVRTLLFSHQRQPAIKGGPATNSDESLNWTGEIQDSMTEVVDGYADMLLREHLFGALRLRLEQLWYLPGYFEGAEPFVRVEVNRAYFSDESHVDEAIEISLMVHRSGICVLTFAMPVAHEFGKEQAHNYLLAGSRLVSKVEVSLPITGKLRTHPSSVKDLPHFMWISADGDLQWLTIQAPASREDYLIAFSTVTNMYMDAVQRAARRKLQSEWRCYTTLFLGEPTCGCSGDEAKTVHQESFSELMVRAKGGMPIQNEYREEVLENHLVNSAEELWLSAGHAVHISWNNSKIDFVKDLYLIEPIESAIVQHRQMQAIDNRTVHTKVRDKDLFAAQERLATGLPEYGRNLMVDINAPRVVEGLSEKLKTPDLYRRLNDRVKVLESIVNTRFTRRQSRRSLAISIIGIAIVVLLLLPRIHEYVVKLSALTPTMGLASFLYEKMGTPDRATIALYLAAVIATVCFFVVATVRVPKFNVRLRKRNFGFATRGELKVKFSPPESAPEGETGSPEKT